MIFYQPDHGQLGKLLVKEVAEANYKKYSKLTIIVAYAKHSGVSRIAEALEDFVAASGQVTAVVGVDQRHTTVEALKLLLQVGARVYIFFDENFGRTFHPKAYWLQSDGDAQWVAIGSNNLTAGGLYLNYELATVSKEPASTESNAKLAALLESLSDSSSAKNKDFLKVLDETLIAELIARGYLLTEAQARASALKESQAGDPSLKQKRIFGSSTKPSLPPIPAKFQLPPTPGSTASGTSTATPQPPPPAAIGPPTATLASPKGFWKKLSNWDVSRTSSPGQMIIPLDLAHFFPPLGVSKTMPSGGTQSDTYFDVEYHDGSTATLVKGARVITYSPAPGHPRKNVDLRFTFLNKAIAQQLSAGDVLKFELTGNNSPLFIMTRIRATAVTTGKKKFGIIP